MKNCSTMDLDYIISKSHYLQDLLLRLPDAQIREMLISPRRELVENLKKRIHARLEMEN
ncbi:hypothetical protein [Marinilabilia sp.]|uniref:hypothetical protein n=1 Tax=Marinilabilia sp. TaxID=2021252 RepID=UPI0025BEE66D|nr:hypothetical protein [Marinilabilia sp.]